MIVPTLYVCHRVEQERRADERREARLWRLLRRGLPEGRPREVLRERRVIRESWVRTLLGNPGL
jgi:hypothetical protein